MNTTDQLPEPDLGYIKTDISNQPAFSARQMREAMKHTPQPAQATQAEVTDEQLNAVALEQWGPHTGGPLAAHRAFARAILALRPERVPMTEKEIVHAYCGCKVNDAPAGVSMRPPTRKVWSASFFIETLEGRMEVSVGDWVITGIKGERYPCKPDIFAATYEPA